MPTLAEIMGLVQALRAQSQAPTTGTTLADLLRPATVNPLMQRQIASQREAQFQSGVAATPWYNEFRQQYGEAPDLSPSANYNYRLAWAGGVRPERDPYDSNRYHWPSALPTGEMLKSETHPTAWKEHYMQFTGKNPDEVGASKEDWLRMQPEKK